MLGSQRHAVMPCRKFQDAQLSFALGNTRPQNLSDRKALLKIDTSVLAPASRLLLDTAQVCIRIYRAAPSLAASMAGALARGKTQVSAGLQPVQFQMLWQSAKLTADAKGITIIDVECSAKAVDAILNGRSTSSKSGFVQQVLHYVQQHEGVRLAVKSAKVRACFMLLQTYSPAHSAAFSVSVMLLLLHAPTAAAFLCSCLCWHLKAVLLRFH